MNLKEFIKKLKRLDKNSKLEFIYWDKKLIRSYIRSDDWKITIELDDDFIS